MREYKEFQSFDLQRPTDTGFIWICLRRHAQRNRFVAPAFYNVALDLVIMGSHEFNVKTNKELLGWAPLEIPTVKNLFSVAIRPTEKGTQKGHTNR